MVILFYLLNPEIRREKVPFWKAISLLLTNRMDIILLEKEILEIFQVIVTYIFLLENKLIHY